MTKYRIVTRLEDNGHYEYFQVQYKGWFFWHDKREDDYYSARVKSYDLKSCEDKVKSLVAKDERDAAIRAKHKAFKSKVVYGPYTP